MQVGDQLAVEKVTKQLATVRAYQRGDVVVFNPTQVRPSCPSVSVVDDGMEDGGWACLTSRCVAFFVKNI